MIAAFAALALGASSGACRTVHGRMDRWNGAPTVRIRVIGSNRVLGVVQVNESFDDLPDAVRAIWASDPTWRLSIVGDYTVCALTRARPERMQMVRLVGARGLAPRTKD